MEKRQIIAAYLLSEVIERETDVFNRLGDLIDNKDNYTKEQLVSNLSLLKGILGPNELKIVKAANFCDIDTDELYSEED